ncbi:Conserved_hypothetical protein [Hexamita inflata]|uniref:Uncharacterized protein n=1 Tax=Hexamita inflata TaxID=28002 RepID=A0ABP1KAZ5_9EUKA
MNAQLQLKLPLLINEMLKDTISQCFQSLRTNIEARPMYVMFEEQLDCDPMIDHLVPKNILPIYDQFLKSAEAQLNASTFSQTFDLLNNIQNVIPDQEDLTGTLKELRIAHLEIREYAKEISLMQKQQAKAERRLKKQTSLTFQQLKESDRIGRLYEADRKFIDQKASQEQMQSKVANLEEDDEMKAIRSQLFKKESECQEFANQICVLARQLEELLHEKDLFTKQSENLTKEALNDKNDLQQLQNKVNDLEQAVTDIYEQNNNELLEFTYKKIHPLKELKVKNESIVDFVEQSEQMNTLTNASMQHSAEMNSFSIGTENNNSSVEPKGKKAMMLKKVDTPDKTQFIYNANGEVIYLEQKQFTKVENGRYKDTKSKLEYFMKHDGTYYYNDQNKNQLYRNAEGKLIKDVKTADGFVTCYVDNNNKNVVVEQNDSEFTRYITNDGMIYSIDAHGYAYTIINKEKQALTPALKLNNNAQPPVVIQKIAQDQNELDFGSPTEFYYQGKRVSLYQLEVEATDKKLIYTDPKTKAKFQNVGGIIFQVDPENRIFAIDSKGTRYYKIAGLYNTTDVMCQIINGENIFFDQFNTKWIADIELQRYYTVDASGNKIVPMTIKDIQSVSSKLEKPSSSLSNLGNKSRSDLSRQKQNSSTIGFKAKEAVKEPESSESNLFKPLVIEGNKLEELDEYDENDNITLNQLDLTEIQVSSKHLQRQAKMLSKGKVRDQIELIKVQTNEATISQKVDNMIKKQVKLTQADVVSQKCVDSFQFQQQVKTITKSSQTLPESTKSPFKVQVNTEHSDSDEIIELYNKSCQNSQLFAFEEGVQCNNEIPVYVQSQEDKIMLVNNSMQTDYVRILDDAEIEELYADEEFQEEEIDVTQEMKSHSTQYSMKSIPRYEEDKSVQYSRNSSVKQLQTIDNECENKSVQQSRINSQKSTQVSRKYSAMSPNNNVKQTTQMIYQSQSQQKPSEQLEQQTDQNVKASKVSNKQQQQVINVKDEQTNKNVKKYQDKNIFKEKEILDTELKQNQTQAKPMQSNTKQQLKQPVNTKIQNQNSVTRYNDEVKKVDRYEQQTKSSQNTVSQNNMQTACEANTDVQDNIDSYQMEPQNIQGTECEEQQESEIEDVEEPEDDIISNQQIVNNNLTIETQQVKKPKSQKIIQPKCKDSISEPNQDLAQIHESKTTKKYNSKLTSQNQNNKNDTQVIPSKQNQASNQTGNNTGALSADKENNQKNKIYKTEKTKPKATSTQSSNVQQVVEDTESNNENDNQTDSEDGKLQDNMQSEQSSRSVVQNPKTKPKSKSQKKVNTKNSDRVDLTRQQEDEVDNKNISVDYQQFKKNELKDVPSANIPTGIQINSKTKFQVDRKVQQPKREKNMNEQMSNPNSNSNQSQQKPFASQALNDVLVSKENCAKENIKLTKTTQESNSKQIEQSDTFKTQLQEQVNNSYADNQQPNCQPDLTQMDLIQESSTNIQKPNIKQRPETIMLPKPPIPQPISHDNHQSVIQSALNTSSLDTKRVVPSPISQVQKESSFLISPLYKQQMDIKTIEQLKPTIGSPLINSEHRPHPSISNNFQSRSPSYFNVNSPSFNLNENDKAVQCNIFFRVLKKLPRKILARSPRFEQKPVQLEIVGYKYKPKPDKMKVQVVDVAEIAEGQLEKSGW